MKVKKLLDEYGLEIDDVRWYLSTVQAGRLLEYGKLRDGTAQLARHIWCGGLEDELYDMEEQFLVQLQSDWERGLNDEARVREVLQEMSDLRTQRSRSKQDGSLGGE